MMLALDNGDIDNFLIRNCYVEQQIKNRYREITQNTMIYVLQREMIGREKFSTKEENTMTRLYLLLSHKP